MPIRFRCPNCHQLLGIARRKAGTQVDCPTCEKSVTVPAHDDPDLAAEGGADRPPSSPVPAGAVPKPGLFERSDFDINLPVAPRPAAPLAAAPVAKPPSVNVMSPVPAVPAPGVPANVGITLTPTQATIITVVVIVLLAVAFGVGLLVGRFAI